MFVAKRNSKTAYWRVWSYSILISAANEATIRHHEADHHKTREYFAATQDATEARRDYEAQIKQLLNSLHDKEMNIRRNQIEKSHTATFSWAFDKEIQRPWAV
jgi:hypothetical protein